MDYAYSYLSFSWNDYGLDNILYLDTCSISMVSILVERLRETKLNKKGE